GFLLLVMAVASAAQGWGQMPVAAPPQVYLDTTWNPPTGGRTWKAHTAAEFQSALDSSSPGDVIVLDSGASYLGSFTVPAKNNPSHKWIYIEGSELASLPASGKRVDPDRDAAKMPKIVATSVSPAISIFPGASYYRFA